MKKKQWAILGSFVIAIVLFILVFWLTGTKISDVQASFHEAGLNALFAVILAMIIQLFLQAISWLVLLWGCGHRINLFHGWAAIFMGWAGNFMTPSLYLGGEPIRAYALTKTSGLSFRKSLSSVLVHKFLEFVSFLFFILVSAFFSFCEFQDSIPGEIQYALLSGLGLLASLFVFSILAILLRKHFFSSLARFLIFLRIARNFLQNNLEKIREMDEMILDAFFKTPLSCLHSLLWMFLFHALVFLRPLAFFYFLGIPLSLGKLSLLFLMIQMVLAFQFTPGGIGILEGGMVGIFALIHISSAYVLGYATFCRVADLVVVSIGFSLPLYYGINSIAMEKKLEKT